MHARDLSWDQNCMRMDNALDMIWVEDFKKCFETVVENKPEHRNDFARLYLHVLDFLLDFEVGGHQSSETSTPRSLLKAVKLHYNLSALLLSADGQATRRNRFRAVKRG